MKRLRSSDDLGTFGEKDAFKDWGRRDDEMSLRRSSSHRSFHYKSENGRTGISSSFSSRYDRLEDDRESSRLVRKRSDYEDGYDRRVGHDRYREGSERGILSSSPRSGYSGDRIHRSESFSRSPRREIPKGESFSRSPRREIPKGFRSERDRPRREASVSSWQRFGAEKDIDNSTLGGNQVEPDEKVNMRFSQKIREVKSPPCSKDSESEQSKITRMKDLVSEQSKSTKRKDSVSEQSKSIKRKDSESEQSKSFKRKDLISEQSKSTKRKDSESEETKCTKMIEIEDLRVESGCSSEMEEGELEPEPEPEPKARGGAVILPKKLESEELGDSKIVENEAKSVSSVVVCKDAVGREEREKEVKALPELKSNKDGVSEEKLKFESQKTVEDLVKALDVSAQGQRSSVRKLPVNEDAFETTEEKGENNDDHVEELIPMKEGHEECNFVNHMIEDADIGFTEPNTGVWEGSEVPKVGLCERVYSISPSFKDKGKNVVTSPSNAIGSEEEGVHVPRESNHLFNFKPDDIEGQSTMGLDLFINHPVKQPEKQHLSGFGKPKDERLELEPFDLSLSLPNVLLPIDSHNRGPVPSSPSHVRCIQSNPSIFRTNSDGFTASMSFTGSQSFRHNASCSLTNNPFDQFEQSVSSRPLFGGVDKVSAAVWQGQPSNEQNRKEVPALQKALSNGDGFPMQDRQLNFTEISYKQLSLNKSTNSRHSSGSHENRSEFTNDKNRITKEKVSSSLYEGNNPNEEQFVRGGADSVEPIITMIISEPVHVISKKFNEMNEQAIITLKEGVRDIVVNSGKRWQLSLVQKTLINRSDVTLNMLLKANRAQLEILVALKTGAGEFLSRNQNISSSDMAEIYLNLRCRNLTCRSLLPVDECDCKVCSRNSGFCSNCMCLVCSKYDMSSNTCSWVGCDMCLHWCHADCALRESYIRNGCVSYGTHELREMQFHCVACDHPSEMFGFVKEVFQTFAKEWTVEKLSKELEYVRKIFSASEDMRGKKLHDISLKMLSRLVNKSYLRVVQSQIMSFFTESGSIESNDPTVRSGKELFNKNHEMNNENSGPSQEDTWLKPLHSEKAPQLPKASSFKSYDNNSSSFNPNLQPNAPKEHDFDELDSIVRIKEAEAQMFQTRADDARREAEGLKRISTAKNQKIDEEYASRISKLRLVEVEEKRKHKIEELQGMERAYREYFSMKMRMEADISHLLSKMESTKRNLAM